MPTDVNGNYSLPAGYLATTGEDIVVTQHNPPFEDVASALTARLPRNGAAPMTGQLKLSDGTVTAPAIAFASDTNWGLYKTDDGIGIAIDGVLIGMLGGTPAGTILDYAGSTAPEGYLLCYGQAVSRSTYSTLFTAIGTTYGVGDGSSTFNLPDLRGRAVFGKDNMGGSAASRITDAVSSVDGTTLGDTGGAQSHTLTTAQLPAHYHDVYLNDPGHSHGGDTNSSTYTAGSGGATVAVGGAAIPSNTTGITVRSASGGGGTANRTHTSGSTMDGDAHPILNPAIILNKIIKT